MYKERIITSRLKKLFDSFPSVVILGARQVGKSTLVQHVFPKLDYFVFDPVIDMGNARSDPDLFLDNHPAPVILDEIQYAPELAAAIKRRIDKTQQPGQYLITGSQQWAVMKSISDSLAGRAVFLNLESFSLREIYEQTSKECWLQRWLENDSDLIKNKPIYLETKKTLYEHLWQGWLPGAGKIDSELIQDFYNSYLQTYIERDARLISDTADWQQFGRFVQLIAALTAQEINYSQLGRELSITPQTAQRWLATLTATFQWFEIPAYHGNTLKRISNKPKGFFADTGLACALQMISSPKALSGNPLLGALFETAVIGELRKLYNSFSSPAGLCHWRSHSGGEVDVILERDGRFFPIEIKATTKPSKNDCRGITAFRKTYPDLSIAPGLIICACETFQQLTENDYAIPWNTI
ncbi:MAG: ATP-binding protein [Sedimentisphaerales bacterium]|nr:ATP-binding protein [Sedimentisphaerales bacterium]